jgi:hypothetical protein
MLGHQVSDASTISTLRRFTRPAKGWTRPAKGRDSLHCLPRDLANRAAKRFRQPVKGAGAGLNQL